MKFGEIRKNGSNFKKFWKQINISYGLKNFCLRGLHCDEINYILEIKSVFTSDAKVRKRKFEKNLR